MRDPFLLSDFAKVGATLVLGVGAFFYIREYCKAIGGAIERKIARESFEYKQKYEQKRKLERTRSLSHQVQRQPSNG
jgi:hypothetical protein